MRTGFLPRRFRPSRPDEDRRAYAGDYLKEEIAAEGLTRDLPAFSEFLRVAAPTSSEPIDHTNAGRESGVSAKVVRNCFDILEDTSPGYRIPPWRGARSCRLIDMEKFYLREEDQFDRVRRRVEAARRAHIAGPSQPPPSGGIGGVESLGALATRFGRVSR